MEIYGGTTGIASSATHSQVAPVSPGEIQSLVDEIARYAATIDDLYTRLDPVLKPEYAEASKATDHPMAVVSQIATLRSQIAENTSRLQALLSRVDL